jgi:acyl carrier protein
MIDSIDAEKVRAAARKVVEKQLGYSVADDDTLVSSGLIDSLSVVQLIAALEKELNVQLPAATLQPDDFDTIDYTVETVMRVAR